VRKGATYRVPLLEIVRLANDLPLVTVAVTIYPVDANHAGIGGLFFDA
jgi:hypothetical protein